MDQNGVQTAPQGARESPTTESPFVLTLKNVGPLSEARVELIRGLTILYGLHSTGKTTVARALRLLARLNAGVATAEDVVGLVKRYLRYVDRSLVGKEDKVGRIVYGTADAELEILCIPDVRGAWLRIGRWERRVDMDERLPAVDRPKIALFWVTRDSIKLYGAGMQERHLTLEGLLTPSVFRTIVARIYDDAMELYEETLNQINKILETIDYTVEYRDRLYFKNGIHVYTPDETSSGVRRFALMYTAAVMAKTFAEYAKVTPMVFVENLEDSLDVTLMSAIIDVLRTKGIVAVAETHSGFPLKAALVRKHMNYYVFANGEAVKELRLELFEKEIAEWSDVDTL